MSNIFKAVKAKSPSFAKTFCRRYLSSGKCVGDWWIVSTPWREDKNPSLGICLTSGNWKDFARGDGGDLADLLAKIDRCSITEAADRLARMMGIPCD